MTSECAAVFQRNVVAITSIGMINPLTASYNYFCQSISLSRCASYVYDFSSVYPLECGIASFVLAITYILLTLQLPSMVLLLEYVVMFMCVFPLNFYSIATD